MPNWCFNTVTFKASDDQMEKIKTLFTKMELKSKQTEEGHLPEFITEKKGYFFYPEMLGDTVTYLTKWIPNLDILVEMAYHYQADFKAGYSETMCLVYGEALFVKGNYEDVHLSPDDFELFAYDEAKGLLLFEGEVFEDEERILEILLERKKAFREVVSGNN